MYLPLADVPEGRQFEVMIEGELRLLTKVVDAVKQDFTLAIDDQEKYHHIVSRLVVKMTEQEP